MKQIAIALLIVTALSGAAGGFYGLRAPAPDAAPAAKANAEEKPAAAASLPANSGLLDLAPIITNLSVPQDTWVRLEASLLYDDKALPHPEALGAEISGDILAYLRTTTLTQIQGIAGLQNLRQDLNERVAIRSNGAVKALVIRTLVLQ
jgi:flagellar protein FliL